MNILSAIKTEERNLTVQIDKLQKRRDGLRAAAKLLGGYGTDGVGATQRRGLSPAGRARIVAAAKRRWAKARAGENKDAVRNGATQGVAKTHKRVMSAAARAKISRAMKQRWAKTKAGAKKAVS